MPRVTPGVVKGVSNAVEGSEPSIPSTPLRNELGLARPKSNTLAVPPVVIKMFPRFDIPMDDPLGMGGGQSVSYLQAPLHHLLNADRMARDALAQHLTLEQLHRNEGSSFVFANVIQRANMGVAESRNRAGLALEPLLQVRITGNMLGQYLDGDGAVEASVTCLIHLAHATGAEGGFDLVRAEGGARLERHGLRDGHALFEFLEQLRIAACTQADRYDESSPPRKRMSHRSLPWR